MNKRDRPFKETQVFGWDEEPAEERPADFARSTGFSALSGHSVLPDIDGPATRRQRHRSGANSLLLGGSLVLALSVAGLYALIRLLHA